MYIDSVCAVCICIYSIHMGQHIGKYIYPLNLSLLKI